MPSLKDVFIPDVILIDAMNLCKRYYYALQLFDDNGLHTGVAYGILKYVHGLRKKYTDAQIIFLWEGENVFRFKLYPQYKANRGKVPDKAFDDAVKLLQKVLAYYNIRQVSHYGIEADDLAGCYCDLYKHHNILLVSNDYDWFQYISKCVQLQTLKRVYDYFDAREKLGFPPERIIIYKTLTGDAVDNIKGIVRFPKKLAVALCNKIGTLDGLKNWSVFYNLDVLSEKVRLKWFNVIKDNWARLELIYSIVAYDSKNVRAGYITSYGCIWDPSRLKRLLLKHNMKKLVNILGV